MDPVTAMTIDRGRKNNELLIQPQYSPMPVGDQVAILYCGTRGLMQSVPLEKVRDFQSAFLDRMHASHEADVLAPLAEGKFDSNIESIIQKEASATALQFRK